MKTLLAIAVYTAALPHATQAEGVTLTVEGLRNDRGNVLIAVFDQARTFDRLLFENAVGFAEVPARRGQVKYQFPALTSGPYAIFLFHDENGNRDIDNVANTLLEGIGASGANTSKDEPSFAQASFLPGQVRVGVHYDQ